MKIAALQFAPVRSDVRQNIGILSALISGVDCALLVLPELASTGYFFTDPDELHELAENPADGLFCEWMRGTAVADGVILVGGFAEEDNGRIYNSAMTALPDGRWFVYRKTHLFYREKSVFEPGDSGFAVVEHDGFRLGTMICYDWRFPEAARTLALRGADLIAHPSNLVAAASLWGPTVRTRAFENRVAVVTANRHGSETLGGETLEFSGCSQITGVNGGVLASAGPVEDGIITAEFDPKTARRKSFNAYNDIFADRRPEMYQ